MSYAVINIEDSMIESQDNVGNNQYQDIKSGMYKCQIKQAYIRESKSSHAVGITFDLHILTDEVGKEIKQDKSATIWYLKGDGTMSDYGVGLIGSLLGILGLPKKLGGESFVDGLITIREFNQDTKQYENVEHSGTRMPAVEGKVVWCILGLTYQLYNGAINKNWNLNSFFDDRKRSYSEMKENRNPSVWTKRLESAKKKEQKTYTENNVGAYQQASYSAPNTYQSYQQQESDIANEYARLQESLDQPYTQNGNMGEIKKDEIPF